MADDVGAPAAPAADPAAQPWLSVLIPVHDTASRLRQCVESVLAEADDGVELLLLDDASTDSSLALMRMLAQEHGARIRLLQHDSHRGTGAARNSLLDAARGQHLWFVDANDWLSAEALPRLREILSANVPPDLVFCDYRSVSGRATAASRPRAERHRRGFVGRPRTRLAGGPALLAGALASGNLCSWTHVAHRALWQGGPRFPEGVSSEDMATTPRLLLRAANAWYEPEIWVMHRRARSGSADAVSPESVRDLAGALQGVRQALLERWPDAPELTRFALAHQAARNFLDALRQAAKLPERDALARQAREAFNATVGEDLSLLRRGYLKRGWVARSLRLHAALSGAGAA